MVLFAGHFSQHRDRGLELAGAQPLQLAHRDQRMPVHGVDMVEVVQHAGVKVAELRDQRAQHA